MKRKQKNWMSLKSHCLKTCPMTAFPTKLFFSRRLILAESSVQTIIRFLLSSALATGIIAEVEARRPIFNQQERNGAFLQKIESLPSKQLNHTLNKLLGIAQLKPFFILPFQVVGDGLVPQTFFKFRL